MQIGVWFLTLIWLIAENSIAGVKQPQLLHLALISIGKADVIIPQVKGLYDGLEEAGYIDGKNLAIHYIRKDTIDELEHSLRNLVRQRLNVIVATSAIETAIARQVTSVIPIIFAPSVDPVRMGFVKSRANPATNLTGLSFTRDVEDNGKQLSVFKQIVPSLRRVTMFYDERPPPEIPGVVRASVKRIAQHLGIQLIEHGVSDTAAVVRVLDQMPKGTIDGVFLICTAGFRGMKGVADAAARKGAPLFGCTASQVADEGALMTYAPDIYLIGYRAAWYVDRILKGAKPGQLPVEAPSKLELVINLKNARSIGLKIPPERLILADKVFQ